VAFILEFSKAFNSISHDILLRKLRYLLDCLVGHVGLLVRQSASKGVNLIGAK
jgi:hypothetical protein